MMKVSQISKGGIARCVIGIVAITGLFPIVCLAADPVPRSVLIFSQGSPDAPWPSAIHHAIRSTLSANATAPVSISIEELDLARFGGLQFEQVLSNYLRERYRQKPIGVIVTVGSEALELLLRLRAELWTDVPIVFAAVDEATAARLAHPFDVAGSTMRLRFSDAVAAAKVLVPNFRRLVLVGNPLEDNPFRRELLKEIPKYKMELDFIDASKLTLAEIKGQVAALPNDAAIYYTGIYYDRKGINYAPYEALGMVAKVANRPIVVDAETFLGEGAAGGFVLDPTAIGAAAARHALRILGGESASSIPVTAGIFTKAVFDWRQLKRWNVKESSLPPESEVRFRPTNIWELYQSQMTIISVAMLIQATMIAWLLTERRRRHFAQLESRGRLREVIHLDRVAAVGAMSASIAQELNQPLGSILAYAETAEILLEKDPIDHVQLRAVIANIIESDQRAGEIIAHLRGLLKKTADVELQEFDLNNSIQDVLRMLEPEARKRGVLMSAGGEGGALLQVRADRVHLEQAILNLVINAMDSMLDCALGTRKLTIKTALLGASEVMVSVSDSGTGIPDEKLEDVFKTFYTTKQNGTGLGLSIVRTIVESAGGKIWAENRVGGGAVFRFTLPVSNMQAN